MSDIQFLASADIRRKRIAAAGVVLMSYLPILALLLLVGLSTLHGAAATDPLDQLNDHTQAKKVTLGNIVGWFCWALTIIVAFAAVKKVKEEQWAGAATMAFCAILIGFIGTYLAT